MSNGFYPPFHPGSRARPDAAYMAPPMPASAPAPPEFEYPVAVLERTGSLGPFIQIVTNFKVWFDASTVSLLIQGAPDLHEYGLYGGSGLMTRSHAADKIDAYADPVKAPWKEGLSFNFVNIHLQVECGRRHHPGPAQHAAVHRAPGAQPAKLHHRRFQEL